MTVFLLICDLVEQNVLEAVHTALNPKFILQWIFKIKDV